ncbi:hypothetical protein CR513_31166, partial [Mucuna pruriens]
MQVGQLADIGEEFPWRDYEALENYYSWTSLNRVWDQPKPRSNRELAPGCSNRPRAFHYHSPIE